ncbi:hypothetical protein KM915_06660 [Cytobacillus oceanisediminis]|uniref:hypothetical protein n=1 Tax=Cytobacillus oceanisediminis TaxID=665099 RepID=UPI001C248E6F|nr:hypothetical protein [Cytobacillus oceanisediminis]MBU8729735.1 hypothetical protein [Cytobacillus oceanisediminis]
MESILTKSEIDEAAELLTVEQRFFLENRLKIRKKSQWLQVLAKYKGVDINENMTMEEIESKIDDWILIDFRDGGYKKLPYKCDCGQSLRYQYIIQNKQGGEIRKLGEGCFEKYISLPPSVIKDVKSGMYNIDLERDEILTKLKRKLFFPLDKYLHLELPSEIVEQHQVGLPLTDIQSNLVLRMHERYEEEKRLAKVFNGLNGDQKHFVSKMRYKERRELLLLLEDGYMEELIPDEELHLFDEDIQNHMKLKLPLIGKQQSKVNKIKASLKRVALLQKLDEKQKEWVLGYSENEQDEILRHLGDPIYYYNDKPESIPLSEEVQTHITLNLPLLNRQLREIHIMKQQIKEEASNSSITLGTLMDRHLGTLRAVREKESAIPPGLLKDWGTIQELTRQLQNGEEFDYGTFKLLLKNLLIPLRIEKDLYL